MRTRTFETLEEGKTYLTDNETPVSVSRRMTRELGEGGLSNYPFMGSDGITRTDRGTVYMFVDNPRDLILEVAPGEDVQPGEYPTKGGLQAVVLATNAPDKEYPLVGYVKTSSGHTEPTHWSAAGEWIAGKPGSPRDLVLSPPPVPTLREAAEVVLRHFVRIAPDELTKAQSDAILDLRAALDNEQP